LFKTENFFLDLFSTALQAVSPAEVFSRNVFCSENNLTIYEHSLLAQDKERLFLLGVGKASVEMAGVFISRLNSFWQKRLHGLLIAKDLESVSQPYFLANLPIFYSAHPEADTRSLLAGEKMLEILRQVNSSDFVVFLLSGGASSLMEKPLPIISSEKLFQLYHLLVPSGLKISEINPIRQYFSQIKGGGLLNFLNPSKLFTLAISDVEGDYPEYIGSAPTWPVKKEKDKVIQLLQKAGIFFELFSTESFPESVSPEFIEKEKLNYRIIASLALAQEAAFARAKENNWLKVLKNKHFLSGDSSEITAYYLDFLQTMPGQTLLISGGEPTVKICGTPGKGGRNTHLVLEVLLALYRENFENVFFFSAATDGNDGNTSFSGAWGSSAVIRECLRTGDNPETYWQNYDSQSFFAKYGGLVQTGNTGTNVNDLHFFLRL